MANLEQYSKVVVYLDGSLLAEESEVTIKRTGGAQAVKTVAKGLAGPSPGAPMIEVSVTNAIPAADFEMDPGTAIRDTEIHELTLFAAGRTLTSNGWITDDNLSHAVETASKLMFNFTGQYAVWD